MLHIEVIVTVLGIFGTFERVCFIGETITDRSTNTGTKIEADKGTELNIDEVTAYGNYNVTGCKTDDTFLKTDKFNDLNAGNIKGKVTEL